MLLLNSLFLHKMVIEAGKAIWVRKRNWMFWNLLVLLARTWHWALSLKKNIWKWTALWSRTQTGQSSRAGEQESFPCAASDQWPNHLHCLCWPALSAGSVQPAFAAEQGLGQQHPAPRGHTGLWMMAEPGTAQRCPRKHLSLQCRRSLACLCLGCCLHNGDNGISHRRCGNSAINTRETGDYAVLALSGILFSVTARRIDSSNAGFRGLSRHHLAKKKAILAWSNLQTSPVK